MIKDNDLSQEIFAFNMSKAMRVSKKDIDKKSSILTYLSRQSAAFKFRFIALDFISFSFKNCLLF